MTSIYLPYPMSYIQIYEVNDNCHCWLLVLSTNYILIAPAFCGWEAVCLENNTEVVSIKQPFLSHRLGSIAFLYIRYSILSYILECNSINEM